MTAATCDYDLYGKRCSIGVCIQLEKRGCAKNYFGEYRCDTSKWKQTSCGTCTSPGCSKCAINSGSNMVSSEECLGPSCNNIQKLNITFSQCPSNLDYYGNPCSCCYALNNQYTTPPGVCYDEFLRNILNSLIYDNNSIKPDSDLTKPVKNNPYITKDNY